MDFLKFFKNKQTGSKNVGPVTFGGTGSLPALGSIPSVPALPALKMDINRPIVPEPSENSLKSAKNVIKNTNSLQERERT